MNQGLYTPNCIRTFKGHYIDPFNPDPDKIDLSDIVNGLSKMPRFAGHTHKPFSVLAHVGHCLYIMRRMPDYLSRGPVMRAVLTRYVLLHDASEAYVCDIPSPIKNRLPDYKAMETRLQMVIYKKFIAEKFLESDSQILGAVLKYIDRMALEAEWDSLFEGTYKLEYSPFEFEKMAVEAIDVLF